MKLTLFSSRIASFENGYDSDGESGPFCDVVKLEGPQIFEEDNDDEQFFVQQHAIGNESIENNVTVDASNTVEGNSNSNNNNNESNNGIHEPIEDDVVDKMTVKGLKDELKNYGYSLLVERSPT